MEQALSISRLQAELTEAHTERQRFEKREAVLQADTAALRNALSALAAGGAGQCGGVGEIERECARDREERVKEREDRMAAQRGVILLEERVAEATREIEQLNSEVTRLMSHRTEAQVRL